MGACKRAKKKATLKHEEHKQQNCPPGGQLHDLTARSATGASRPRRSIRLRAKRLAPVRCTVLLDALWHFPKPVRMRLHVMHLPIVELDELLCSIPLSTPKRRIELRNPYFKWPIIRSCIFGLLILAAEAVQTQMPVSKVIQRPLRSHHAFQAVHFVTPTANAIDLPITPSREHQAAQKRHQEQSNKGSDGDTWRWDSHFVQREGER